jgi:hypothetical protein
MFQDEIYSRRIEGRPQDQTANLYLEAYTVEWVAVQDDASDIPQRLISAGKEHCDKVCPSLIANTEEELQSTAHGKDGHEEGICAY